MQPIGRGLGEAQRQRAAARQRACGFANGLAASARASLRAAFFIQVFRARQSLSGVPAAPFDGAAVERSALASHRRSTDANFLPIYSIKSINLVLDLGAATFYALVSAPQHRMWRCESLGDNLRGLACEKLC
jgi:hypothetical protein